MTVESVTYISDLNASNPAAGDAKSEGDDHIRNLKTGIKNTFPNVNGAVSATDEDLSRMAGANTAVFTFSSGKLGLGTATPASYGMFAVVSDTEDIMGVVAGTPATSHMRLSYTGVVDWDFHVNSSGVLRIVAAGVERARIDSDGNLTVNNTLSAPGTPSGGGTLYVESGALKYRGSGGTITTVAPA
jgi:hypothetical protein